MHDQKRKEIVSKSPQHTIVIAREFVSTLRPGDVVYLYGELGSGKTVFVKGICAGLGVTEEVTSPSFVIATEYQGSMKVAHIDLYRLSSGGANNLPIEEYLVDNGITLIEWADRIEVGKRGINIRFTIIDHQRRRIEIEDFRG